MKYSRAMDVEGSRRLVRRLVLVVVLAVIAVACVRNYQQQLAGEHTITIENRSRSTLDIRIHPPGVTIMGQQWGDDIPPGGSAAYKIKAGEFAMNVDAHIKTVSVPITISGDATFVVSEQPIPVDPPAQLVLLYPPAGEGGDGAGGGYEQEPAAGEPERACLPDGTETDTPSDCCSSSKYKPCPEGYSGCGFICCSNTSNCAN